MTQAVDKQRGKPGDLRRGLMLYGSTAALAASLMLADGGIGPAMAQEIGPRVSPNNAAQGDFTVPGPSPTPQFIARSGSLDIVKMNRDAVLNWTTYDNAPAGGVNGNSYVDFVPAGTELRFVGSGQNFTAINRVFTTPNAAGAYRGIAFQGQVTSYLSGDAQGSVGPIGGNIWFYSPGGILATGSASFNVGSLLLSTSDLANFYEGGYFRSVEFTGVADPFSSVVLNTGARVTLTQPNSSFAVVAPTIEQGGNVSVNGSVLYLSAEAGSLEFFNAGEIVPYVTTYAQAGNQIRHLGTTTGPASTTTDDYSIYDPQTIEFRTGRDVATLLSGTIGYAGATDAALGPNGSIVLTGGSVTGQGDLTLSGETSITATTVNLSAGAGETITIGGDANGAYALAIDALDTTLAASAGGAIDILGDVSVASADKRNTITVQADAGQVHVGGNLTLDASVGFYATGGQDGGTVDIGIANGGALDVGGNLTARADAYATQDDSGVTSARGGRVSMVMSGSASSLAVGGDIELTAEARDFSGNCECYGPTSGSALGGYAGLTATEGSLTASTLVVRAGAVAHSGFYGGDNSPSLEAHGGTAEILLGDAAVTVSTVDAFANARAADGSNGSDGGAAVGGTARFEKGAGGSLVVNLLAVTANAQGGDAGLVVEGSNPAGLGGSATGGTVGVAIGQNPVGLGFVELEADALGGQGGSTAYSSALDGAGGGAAQGGSVSLTASGAGTLLTSVTEGRISAAAQGGDGGNGAQEFAAGQSGAGGAGGSATGGSLTITAADGAEYRSPFAPDVSASGGTGGKGGDGSFTDTGTVAPGPGGAGGSARGATVQIIADGGLISGDLQLSVSSSGGSGGLNGFDANRNYTGSGNYGRSDGGSLSLIALDSGASRFDVGDTYLLASGDLAGTIQVLDQSTDPAAAMHFGSFAAYAYGYDASAAPTFRMFAGNNAITVGGTAEIYANAIALDLAGNGQLAVDGYTSLSSTQGGIAITHAGNPGIESILSSGPVQVYASGDYTAGAGSVVRSLSAVSILSLGSIEAADTRGLSSVTMQAVGNASVGDVSAGGSFELYAGRTDYDGTFAYSPTSRALITGTVAASSVTIESGGFAEFASGSSVLSDNAITVRTGDDILLRSGASLVSDLNPGSPVSIYLLAGDINAGPYSGDLVDPITTPIASLVLAGSIDTNGHSLFLSGDAIDARASRITTGNLTVDVTDAPPFPPYSNDAGLLTSSACFQGSACLGSVTATGNVAIGLSNDGLVSLSIANLNFSGANFDAATFETLSLGTLTAPSTLAATNRISLNSYYHDVVLSSVALSAPDLRLEAGSRILAGTSSLYSANSILLVSDVGTELGSVATGANLDDGSGSAVFTTDNYFTAGSITYSGGADIRIDAGGPLSIGALDATGGDIDLVSAADIFVGTTAASTGAILLDGEALAFGTLRATGVVDLTARSGSITSSLAAGSGIHTAGDIALDAAGDVSVHDLTAGGSLAVTGAAISTGALDAGTSLTLTASGAGSVGSFSSGGDAGFSATSLGLGSGIAGGNLSATTAGDLAFTALAVGGNADLQARGAISGGDVAAGRTLNLAGAGIVLGDARSSGALTLQSSGNAAVAGLTSTNGFVTVNGGGDISGGLVSAATSTSLSGANVVLTSATAGTTLDMTLNGQGTLSTFASGGDANFSAATLALGSGSVGGKLSAQTGSGSLGFSALTVAGDARLAAAGALSGGSVTAGGLLQLSGASIGLGAAAGAQGITATTAGGASFTSLTSSLGGIAVDAAGAVSASAASAALGIDLAGASVTLRSARFGSGLTLTARSGDVSGSRLYSGTGAVLLKAAQGVAIGSVDTSGAITLDAGTDARFVELRSGDGALAVTAGGAISGSSVAALGSNPAGDDSVTLNAGGAITLDGAVSTLNPTTHAQDDFIAHAGGAVSLARADAGRDLLATAGAGVLGATNLTSGRDMALSGSAVRVGTVLAGRDLNAASTVSDLTLADATAGGAADLRARTLLDVGSVSAGDTLALSGGRATLGSAAAQGGLTASISDDVTFASLTSRSGAVAVTAGGAVSGGNVAAATGVSFNGGAVVVGTMEGGTDLALRATSLTADRLSAGQALSLNVDALATVHAAAAGGALTISAGSLNAGSLVAGTLLDTLVSGNLAVGSFSSGGNAVLRRVGDSFGSGSLGTGVAGGDLTVSGAFSRLAFTRLQAGGNAALSSSGGMAGGDVAAGGLLSLSAMDLSFATGTGASGASANVGGSLTFNSLSSSAGAVSARSAYGSINGGTISAATDIAVRGRTVTLGAIEAGRDLSLEAFTFGTAPGAMAAIGTARSGGATQITAGSITARSLVAGSTLSVGASGNADIAELASGSNASIAAAAVSLGSATAGRDLSARATAGALSFTNVAAVGAAVLEGATIDGGTVSVGGTLTAHADGSARFGSATAGSDLSVSGGDLDIEAANAGGALFLTGAGSVRLGDAEAAGNLTLQARELDAGTLAAGGSADLGVDGSARVGAVLAGGDLLLQAGALTAGELAAGGAIDLAIENAAAIGSARSDRALTVRAGTLVAETLGAGDGLAVAVSGNGSIVNFTAGAGASISGASLNLGTGTVTGVLTATTSLGDLTFGDLTAFGAMELNAAQALVGGNATTAANLSLRGASLAIGTGAGAAGVTANTAGAASFAALTSSSGAVQVDAGGAVTGSAANASGAVMIAGASVALDSASFGGGLTLTARTGDLTGGGLYQGTGAVNLTAARNAAIGSVDTLGGIAMTSGAETRFVELRSRNGSVAVNAGGAILGSSAAATGSAPGGDVSLVAGGAITLDGAVTALNAASRAQNDLAARAGGAVTIVRAEAGRDLSLSAGTGTVGGANLVAGRDLALTGQSVDLVAGTVAGNLTARATAGAITGSGVTIAGGAIDLAASGDIALGSLSAMGGGLTAAAGGAIRFSDLTASGAVSLSAGTGVAGTGDVSGAAVRVATTNGATTLRDISSSGAIALSGGGSLSLRDVAQTGTGSLTVSYDGAIVLRDVRATGGVDLLGGGSLAFGEIRAPGSVAINAAGAIAGTTLDAGSLSGTGASISLGSVTASQGNVRLATTSGALSASSVSATDVSAIAAGDLALGTTRASGSASLAGASLTLGSATAGNDLTLASAAAGGIGSGALSAGKAIAITAGTQGFAGTTIDAGGALMLASSGGIGFTAAKAGGSADLRAAGAVTGGTLAAASLASIDAGGALALTGLQATGAQLRSSGGPVTASGIAVSGLLDASGTAVTLAAPGALRVEARATAGNLGVTAGGDLRVNGTATGDIALASTGGSVFIGSVGQAAAVPSGIGTESVGGGGAVAVTAAKAISVADSVVAGGALTMTAGGLVSLDGTARGQTIALRAGDLAIGSSGLLGGAQTQRIALSSFSPVNLGSGASGGFAVDTAEFGRIQSGGDLLVSALAGTAQGAGSLTIGSLTVNAGSGGQIGATGTFGVSAAGLLDINAALSIARAGSGNTLALSGDTVDLDYSNAALAVLDSGNSATGRIIVSGRLLSSISAAAAADIVGKTPAQIDTRLGLADVVRDIGLFRTSSLTLDGRDAILIQNSGGSAIDERRGLNVGALTVAGAADGHTLVVINGVVANKTGTGAVQSVTVNGSLAGGSSFNGCAFANAAGCVVLPEPQPALVEAPKAILFGTTDLIKDADKKDDSEADDVVTEGQEEAPPIDTTRIDDPAGQPMIDDPVTGAGNEDLWLPPEG